MWPYPFYEYIYEPSREKTNIVASELSIDPDQPKDAARAYTDIHFSPPLDFLLQESFVYTSIHLRRNMSAHDQSARTAQANLVRYITQMPK